MPTSPTTDPTLEGVAKHRTKRDPRRLLARAALVIWMPTVALGVGSLMVGHWAPLPTPSSSEGSRLSTALAELVTSPNGLQATAPVVGDRWKLIHVLYEDCGCSRRVAEYLVEPERDSTADEWALLVDSDMNRDVRSTLDIELSTAGFRTHPLSADALYRRFGVESAPLFVVLDPSNQVRFVGGYTPRRRGLNHRDIATLDDLRAGSTPVPLPIFGCGVSDALQSALDPLKIKY